MNSHSDACRVIVRDLRGILQTDIRTLLGPYDVKWYDEDGLIDW